MNQAKTAVLERLYGRRPISLGFGMPSVAARARAWCLERTDVVAVCAIVVGVVAAGTYVIAVNVIFLNGQAMRQNENLQKTLERDTAHFERVIAERQSPAWLAAQSQAYGMVAVGTVHYVPDAQSLAIFR